MNRTRRRLSATESATEAARLQRLLAAVHARAGLEPGVAVTWIPATGTWRTARVEITWDGHVVDVIDDNLELVIISDSVAGTVAVPTEDPGGVLFFALGIAAGAVHRP
jgi:hypothetical protein